MHIKTVFVAVGVIMLVAVFLSYSSTLLGSLTNGYTNNISLVNNLLVLGLACVCILAVIKVFK